MSTSVFALSLLFGLPAVRQPVLAVTPVSTQAAVCVVTPRSFDDLALLASTPAASAHETTDSRNPANDEVAAALLETVTHAVACANANDVLRSLALFTDRYVAERFGSEHPDDLGSLEAALSRSPVPADEDDVLTLVAMSDVTTFDETWATAAVVTSNRDGQFADRLVFELVVDQWLIDSWTPIDEPTGTPTASCPRPFRQRLETHTIDVATIASGSDDSITPC